MPGRSEIILLPPPPASGTGGLPAIRRVTPARRPAACHDGRAAPVWPEPWRPRIADAAGTAAGPRRAAFWTVIDAGSGRSQHADAAGTAAAPFVAQRIAQETLAPGLHHEPWDAGEAAYRRAGGASPSASRRLRLAV